MLCVDKRAPMNITFSRLWWLSLISVVEYLLEPLSLETAYWVLITLLLTRVSKSTNMECQLDSIKIYKFLLFIHMHRNCMLSVNDWKGHSALSFLRKLFDNYCMRGLCPSSFYFFHQHYRKKHATQAVYSSFIWFILPFHPEWFNIYSYSLLSKWIVNRCISNVPDRNHHSSEKTL